MTVREVRCETCSKLIKVGVYGAGLSDVIPFTCTRDSTVLILPVHDKKLASVLGGYPPSGWNNSHYLAVENLLKPCPCGGGAFKHDALPKCPNCGAILHIHGLGRSEFVVVGRMIDGEKQDPWL